MFVAHCCRFLVSEIFFGLLLSTSAPTSALFPGTSTLYGQYDCHKGDINLNAFHLSSK